MANDKPWIDAPDQAWGAHAPDQAWGFPRGVGSGRGQVWIVSREGETLCKAEVSQQAFYQALGRLAAAHPEEFAELAAAADTEERLAERDTQQPIYGGAGNVPIPKIGTSVDTNGLPDFVFK